MVENTNSILARTRNKKGVRVCIHIYIYRASQMALVVKSLLANASDIGDVGLIRKIPWRRAWQPTPVFLPGESHGQRSPAGYSP